MDSPAEVSVVVPVRNAEASIGRLLDALEAQTLARERFQVVMVDDASTDGTAAVVEARGFTVVRRAVRGFSYSARNSGLEAATGTVLAFTDADCVPAPEWLESGLAALERAGVHIVAGRIDVPLGSAPSLAASVDAGHYLNQRRAAQEVGYGATANLLVRREVFDKVGGFDERFLSGGDGELCHRAIAAGFELVYAEDCVVSHAARASVSALMRKSFRIGFGVGQMRRFNSGPARDTKPAWANPAWFRRRHWLHGPERLEAAGVPLTGRRRVALEAVQYAFVQMPLVAGLLACDLRRGRRPS